MTSKAEFLNIDNEDEDKGFFRREDGQNSFINMTPKDECVDSDTEKVENEEYKGIFKLFHKHKIQMLHIFSQFLIVLLAITILYSILGKDVLPGSEIFALFFLYVLAVVGGKLVNFIFLPPLLGMLIAGFLYRNLPFIPFYEDISLRWATTLRGCALVVILLKAGLGLDAAQLKKLKAVVLQLAFSPCLVESLTICICAHLFLQLPWVWGILLGFVISAVSPAVVVPSLLQIQEKRLGIRKGIPTLVIAAASVDDILAITGFTIMLSISLSQGSWAWSLLKGLLEPLAGFVFGISFGSILWYVPSKEKSELSVITYRVILLFFGGLAVLFISKVLDFAGAGPFGCLVLGFVACIRWKSDSEIFPRIEKHISVIWHAFEPFLFSLIGCEVTISSLKLNVGNSILVLSIALVCRVLTAFAATVGGGLNWKEKLFVALAWLPKATVQAAIGPQALDYVLVNNKGSEMENYAKQVLSVAVLAILVTAPIGAILIPLLGPILLTKDDEEPITKEDQSQPPDNEIQTTRI